MPVAITGAIGARANCCRSPAARPTLYRQAIATGWVPGPRAPASTPAAVPTQIFHPDREISVYDATLRGPIWTAEVLGLWPRSTGHPVGWLARPLALAERCANSRST